MDDLHFHETGNFSQNYLPVIKISHFMVILVLLNNDIFSHVRNIRRQVKFNKLLKTC